VRPYEHPTHIDAISAIATIVPRSLIFICRR
jgi:hypothetical protein